MKTTRRTWSHIPARFVEFKPLLYADNFPYKKQTSNKCPLLQYDSSAIQSLSSLDLERRIFSLNFIHNVIMDLQEHAQSSDPTLSDISISHICRGWQEGKRLSAHHLGLAVDFQAVRFGMRKNRLAEQRFDSVVTFLKENFSNFHYTYRNYNVRYPLLHVDFSPQR